MSIDIVVVVGTANVFIVVRAIAISKAIASVEVIPIVLNIGIVSAMVRGPALRAAMVYIIADNRAELCCSDSLRYSHG